ncbi:MAG: IS21 family transposase [Acidobacteriota bacterium]
MARRLTREDIVTIKSFAGRGMPKAQIARHIGVTEGAVRYQLQRDHARGPGCGKPRRLSAPRAEVEAWRAAQASGPINLAELHAWLETEHGYDRSLRSVQRAWREWFGVPRKRARRRVETPPGAQAQIDWAHFPNMTIDGSAVDLYAFHMELSHSRRDAVVWSASKNQLAWLACHNGGFRRLGGVPATCRVDNKKTAVVRGAGPWGTINPAYQRYAAQAMIHIDPCRPRTPQAKGKVERRILTQRASEDPRQRRWRSIDELQEWTDERIERSDRRRQCPATGTSVWEAWLVERNSLTPPDHLPEPFDVEVRRAVAIDCLVAFEAHQYSVPFRLVGQDVLVRGCHRTVQIVYGSTLVAEHPRGTARRLVIDSRHFDGEDTDDIVAPTPLGRVGRVLDDAMRETTQVRSIELYARLT